MTLSSLAWKTPERCGPGCCRSAPPPSPGLGSCWPGAAPRPRGRGLRGPRTGATADGPRGAQERGALLISANCPKSRSGGRGSSTLLLILLPARERGRGSPAGVCAPRAAFLQHKAPGGGSRRCPRPGGGPPRGRSAAP